MTEFQIKAPDGAYFDVEVYPAIEAMYAAVEIWEGEKTFAAVCRDQERYVGGELDKDWLGILYFHKNKIGGGVVSHEMFHATATGKSL